MKITLTDPKDRVSRLIYKKIGDCFYGFLDLRSGWRGETFCTGCDNRRNFIEVQCLNTKNNRKDSYMYLVSMFWSEKYDIYTSWSKGTLNFILTNRKFTCHNWITVKESYTKEDL